MAEIWNGVVKFNEDTAHAPQATVTSTREIHRKRLCIYLSCHCYPSGISTLPGQLRRLVCTVSLPIQSCLSEAQPAQLVVREGSAMPLYILLKV
jgi:hypothetical protein